MVVVLGDCGFCGFSACGGFGVFMVAFSKVQ